jgi:phage shock protein A
LAGTERNGRAQWLIPAGAAIAIVGAAFTLGDRLGGSEQQVTAIGKRIDRLDKDVTSLERRVQRIRETQNVLEYRLRKLQNGREGRNPHD